jgi:hypothetical protein
MIAWLLAATVVMGAAGTERLTPERVFAAPELSGPRARGVRVSPDGSMVTYLKARADDVQVTDLWAADVAGGEPRRLIDARALMRHDRALSEAEKSRRERQGVQSHGVVDYAWDEQGRFILVPVEGDLWLYARSTGAVSRLAHGGGDRIDAKMSPKGRFVSFVHGDDLYVMPSSGGAETCAHDRRHGAPKLGDRGVHRAGRDGPRDRLLVVARRAPHRAHPRRSARRRRRRPLRHRCVGHDGRAPALPAHRPPEREGDRARRRRRVEAHGRGRSRREQRHLRRARRLVERR